MIHNSPKHRLDHKLTRTNDRGRFFKQFSARLFGISLLNAKRGRLLMTSGPVLYSISIASAPVCVAHSGSELKRRDARVYIQCIGAGACNKSPTTCI